MYGYVSMSVLLVSVCLLSSASLPLCLSASLPLCLSASLSLCLSICLSVCLSVSPSGCPSVRPFVRPAVRVCVYVGCMYVALFVLIAQVKRPNMAQQKTNATAKHNNVRLIRSKKHICEHLPNRTHASLSF